MKNMINQLPPKKIKLSSLLVGPIKNGYSPVCIDKPTSKKILSLSALNGLGLNFNETKWVPEENTRINNFIIRPGDFLVSRSNTLDKVGRAALYKGGLKNCSYPDLMMRFRANEKKINLDFLELILQSPDARKHFMRRASGTSTSMVKITKAAVESLEIPNLGLEKQKVIVKAIKEWDSAIEKTEGLITAKARQFDRSIRPHRTGLKLL